MTTVQASIILSAFLTHVAGDTRPVPQFDSSEPDGPVATDDDGTCNRTDDSGECCDDDDERDECDEEPMPEAMRLR